MPFIHLENARVGEQKKVMEQINADKLCPFCLENLDKYHKNPILEQGNYWIVTKNQWPYNGAKNHFLAIAKQHVELLSELESEAGAELFRLFQKIAQDHSVLGGTVAMRMGNNERYASTVRHLHVHFIEPDFESLEHEGITFRVSKKIS